MRFTLAVQKQEVELASLENGIETVQVPFLIGFQMCWIGVGLFNASRR